MADIDSNLPVNDTSDGTSGAAAPAIVQQVGGKDGSGNLQPVSMDSTGKVNILNISGTISLPTAASTAALQTTANTSLASIDAGIPVALGQTTMSASMPVVLASDQSIIKIVSTATSTTGSSPAAATLGVASGTAIVANASRKGLIITNTSTLAIVSLNVAGGSALLLSGITLYPRDSWVMDQYSFTAAQIDGISSLASTPIAIQEFT